MAEVIEKEVGAYSELFSKIKKEMSKIVVGQSDVIDSLLRGILSNGHVLVEGVPGIGKTLLIRAIAKIMGCEFSRIQFTPDLLPSDIIGVSTYEKERGFYVLKGPLFANFILADEINRAPPKVQSALLEGMQEKQVTIGKESFKLPFPFFVMATQNPLEQLGTFPLPEAQIDRFMYKTKVTYPLPDEEIEILKKNITIHRFEDFDLKAILNPQKIIEIHEFVKRVYIDKRIEKYVVSLAEATRKPAKYKLTLGKYIQWGASPRASLAMFIGSKAEAILQNKSFVVPQYIKKIAHDILRHRIALNYEGQAEGITTDDIITEILEKVPVP